MPDISQYVKQLNELKMKSMDEYNKAMANYQANYPEFYAQLVQAMESSGQQPTGSKFKDFLGAYKWYLVAIGVGVGAILYLIYVLMTR